MLNTLETSQLPILFRFKISRYISLIKEFVMSGGVIKLPHICPHCEKTIAHTYQELDLLFGFRNMPNGARNQSWCRECRKIKSN